MKNFPTLVSLLLLVAAPVFAQEKPKIRVASLTVPAVAPLVFNAMKERQIDAKHGFNLEIQNYPSISAYNISLAKGEVDALIAGPTVLQKLKLEGGPVRIAATALRPSDLAVVTTTPAIKTLADLRGKQLAADMGSAQYQILTIYAKAKGIRLGSDVTVVNTNFALARSQLTAGRVDAAMVIEPVVTMMLLENTSMRPIFNGAEAWQELFGTRGWELVLGVTDDFAAKPKLLSGLIAAMQEVAALTKQDPKFIDDVAVRTMKLPAGVVKQSLESGRLDIDVQPAWEGERKALTQIMTNAVSAGFVGRLPPETFIYTP